MKTIQFPQIVRAFLVIGILLFLVLSPQVSYGQSSVKTIKPNLDQVHLKVNKQRMFLVSTPSSYNPNRPAGYPVVIMFHGGGGTAQKMYNITKWKELGEREDVITVFPQALSQCVIKEGAPSTKNYWMSVNKMAKPCPGKPQVDDIDFVDAMVQYLKKNYNIDAKKIYASGFSNGCGFILSRIVPERSNLFAAVGAAGSLIQSPYPSMGRKVPGFIMIGQKDSHFTTHLSPPGPLPMTEQGIKKEPFLWNDMIPNLLTTFGHANKYRVKSGKKFIQLQFDQRKGGKKGDFRFAILEGVAHKYPNGDKASNGIRAAEQFWNFFKLH